MQAVKWGWGGKGDRYLFMLLGGRSDFVLVVLLASSAIKLIVGVGTSLAYTHRARSIHGVSVSVFVYCFTAKRILDIRGFRFCFMSFLFRYLRTALPPSGFWTSEFPFLFHSRN